MTRSDGLYGACLVRCAVSLKDFVLSVQPDLIRRGVIDCGVKIINVMLEFPGENNGAEIVAVVVDFFAFRGWYFRTPEVHSFGIRQLQLNEAESEPLGFTPVLFCTCSELV